MIVSVCETPEVFDSVEDGHEGAVVDANGKLLMSTTDSAETAGRISRSIRTHLGQNQEEDAFDIVRTPVRIIKGTWRWIQQQF